MTAANGPCEVRLDPARCAPRIPSLARAVRVTNAEPNESAALISYSSRSELDSSCRPLSPGSG